MFSTKLSLPLNTTSLGNHDDIIDGLYDFFKKDLLNKENRIRLYNKFIFLDCSKWIAKKSELFWHLISLNEKEKFNVLPCNNCISGSSCPSNCLNTTHSITLSNGTKRNICYYRGARINWISDIIRLANNGDNNIYKWIEKDSKGISKLYIRFNHEAADYVLVFEEKIRQKQVSHYQLISAFPVFYINKKIAFRNNYTMYMKTLIPKK